MAKKSVSNTISDPTVGKVAVEINGKTLYLAYDFNSLARAEAETGINMLSVDVDNLNASTLRALLFASLLKFQPDMALDDAGDLITLATAGKLTEALGKAYSASVAPPADENAPKNGQVPEKK